MDSLPAFELSRDASYQITLDTHLFLALLM